MMIDLLEFNVHSSIFQLYQDRVTLSFLAKGDDRTTRNSGPGNARAIGSQVHLLDTNILS